MDYQLLALEKRERFLAIKERIAALHHGDKRKVFLQHLEDAEYALFAFDIERAVGAARGGLQARPRQLRARLLPRRDPLQRGRAPSRRSAYFARVLEVKPDHYEGLVYSGVIHYERGDHDARRGAT